MGPVRHLCKHCPPRRRVASRESLGREVPRGVREAGEPEPDETLRRPGDGHRTGHRLPRRPGFLLFLRSERHRRWCKLNHAVNEEIPTLKSDEADSYRINLVASFHYVSRGLAQYPLCRYIESALSLYRKCHRYFCSYLYLSRHQRSSCTRTVRLHHSHLFHII